MDYEIPEMYASIAPPIPLEHNTAYGKVSHQHGKMTENTQTISLQYNTAYGKVSVQQ